ncbi:hypothetical protein BDF22DRAFT_696361 [Syncephalis plumigaleata]|nr:hypothetical protein BDF22DRAFT_696361 [Syncephalis plumigaleata]
MVSLSAILSRQWQQPSASATIIAIGLLTNLLSMVSIVSSEATDAAPRAEKPLSKEKNPYGFRVTYEVVWANKQVKPHVFGGRFSIALDNPVKGANWSMKVQFADDTTRPHTSIGSWKFQHIDKTTLFLGNPTPMENGVDIVQPGDKSNHTYSFYGYFENDELDSIFPNYYAVASKDGAEYVTLTQFEAGNQPIKSNLSTKPIAEFDTQKHSVSTGQNANTIDNNSPDATAANSNSSTGSTGGSNNGAIGAGIFGCCMAVGLTVVGIATYRRREYRRDFNSKKDDATLPKYASGGMPQDSVKMPPPSAINNYSTAARAAAGAVIMEEMNADQGMAEEYYVMEDVAPDAHHHHLEMAADEYNAIEAMPEHDDGVYYAEYDAELHQEFYPVEGEGHHQYEDEQYVEDHGNVTYEGEYVEGLPDYAIQYEDQIGYDGHVDDGNQQVYQVDDTANRNSSASGNGAVEHVDLRPAVAQEYYVSDAVAYDAEGHQINVDQMQHDGYGHTYEAGDYEAADFDDGHYEQQQSQHHHQY